MSSRRHCFLTVSPLLCPNLADSDPASELKGKSVVDEFVLDVKKHAVLDEATVGVEAVVLDGRGQGALTPRPLPTPKEPTAAAREKHNLTHIPYEDWCPFCVSCRRPNDHHRLSLRSEREHPLLVGDYAFVRNTGDDQLICILIC